MAFDKRRIPDSYYIRLVELMGKEKAERFLVECDYNFKSISWKISWLGFIKNVRKKPGQALMIIVLLIYLLLRFLWLFIIEPFFF